MAPHQPGFIKVRLISALLSHAGTSGFVSAIGARWQNKAACLECLLNDLRRQSHQFDFTSSPPTTSTWINQVHGRWREGATGRVKESCCLVTGIEAYYSSLSSVLLCQPLLAKSELLNLASCEIAYPTHGCTDLLRERHQRMKVIPPLHSETLLHLSAY